MPAGGNAYVTHPNPDGAVCEVTKQGRRGHDKWYYSYFRVPRAEGSYTLSYCFPTAPAMIRRTCRDVGISSLV